MQKQTKRLFEILGREVGLYAELLDLKAGERESLLRFSTKGLEEGVEMQSNLTNRATNLEIERLKLVREMAKACGVSGTPTLREVSEWLPEDRRDVILELGDELTSLCEKIALQQGANTELINTSAEYLKDLVENLIRRSQPDLVAYTPTGEKTPGRETNPSLLDRTL